MRQRRIKDIDIKLSEVKHLMIPESETLQGKWRELFIDDFSNTGKQSANLYVELGCGRGRFINCIAEKNPSDLFVAVEGSDSVIYKALLQTFESEIKNIRYLNQYVKEADGIFAENEISGLFLNFSDPWPKIRHEKRRLTAPEKIERYKKILAPDGFIALKTDNTIFFEYSLEKMKECKLDIVELTHDLHSSEFVEKNVLSEYERKFINLGQKIMYLKAVVV